MEVVKQTERKAPEIIIKSTSKKELVSRVVYDKMGREMTVYRWVTVENKPVESLTMEMIEKSKT